MVIGILGIGPEYTAILCKHDGHLLGVGKTLLEHYSDEQKVLDLIALGSIQSLGPELGSAHNANAQYQGCEKEGQPDWTVAYARDWGEPWNKGNEPQKFTERFSLRHFARGGQCDRVYGFDLNDNEWYVYSSHVISGMLLSAAVEEAEKLVKFRDMSPP